MSVFLDDEVVRDGDPEYLRDLYAQVRESSEFEEVTLEIRSVPPTAEGARFVQQFLGRGPGPADWPAFPRHERMMRKKARVMLHWAPKTGADVVVADKPHGERGP